MRNFIQTNAKQAVAGNNLGLVAGTNELRTDIGLRDLDSLRGDSGVRSFEKRALVASAVQVTSGPTAGITGSSRYPAPFSYEAGLGDGVPMVGCRCMAVVERLSNWHLECHQAFQAAA